MTPETFAKALEGYFNKQYTREQRIEIARWAKGRNARVLQVVYRRLVADETFLPLVARLNHALQYAYEAYPELEPYSANAQAERDRQAITDDAGWTEDDVDRAFAELRAIVEPVQERRRYKA